MRTAALSIWGHIEGQHEVGAGNGSHPLPDGGAAYGARLLQDFAPACPDLLVPNHVCVPASTSADELVVAVRAAHERFGTGVALRYSGVAESFSPQSRRGVNSTGIRYTQDTIASFDASAAEELLRATPSGTVTIMLQEMIVGDLLGPIHAYAEADGITIELRRRHGVRLVYRPGTGDEHDESCGTPDRTPRDENQAIRAVSSVAAGLYDRLQFGLDLEGFWNGSRFAALQLRPIPPDLPTDARLTPIVQALAGGGGYATQLVWGAFDVTGTVAGPDSIGPVAVFSPQARQHGWDATTAARAGLPGVLLLDPTNGFHLSHDHRFLPPAGPLRCAFRYLSVAGWAERDALVGRRIRCVSDGRSGAAVIL
ncbi:MAG TPA: hypothetical protein VFC19_11755 [Candidatus Limnocylindrales bacterium]|nr:hypothetical protein [Candidatus Limnocylindrales bacterium]